MHCRVRYLLDFDLRIRSGQVWSRALMLLIGKGQLISKTNCQAMDSSKKRTNEFVFTSMRRVFVRFLEESSARKKRFEII